MIDLVYVWGEGGHGRVVAEAAELSGSFLMENDGKVPVIIGFARREEREALAKQLGDAGRSFRSVVHPRAWVSPKARIEPGTYIGAGAVVNAGATVGRHCVVNTGAVVEHDCFLAEGAHVSPGAVLCGRVCVSRYAWVGAGAVILPGLSVGAYATVGAGAVVLHSVAAYDVVAGNPARVLRTAEKGNLPCD